MAQTYQLQIITPQGIAYEGAVLHAEVPAEKGFVGVMANHAPFITSSAGGRLKLREKNAGQKAFIVGSGFFEVKRNQAVFITQKFSPAAN
ncbi:MAG: F0F1 ATP synthase subunit epsilon [Candidatus Omnitrophica bacterium]|nr:F0F1 ATP synthase subunit epsilon [Candidatus Omnitrophota bacterium]